MPILFGENSSLSSDTVAAFDRSLQSKSREGWESVYGVQSFMVDNLYVDLEVRQGNMYRAVPGQQVRISLKSGVSVYRAQPIAQTTFALGGYLQGNMSEQQFVSRLSRALTTIPERKADDESELVAEKRNEQALRAERVKPFPGVDALKAKQGELDVLIAEMTAEANPEDAPENAAVEVAAPIRSPARSRFTPPTAQPGIVTQLPQRPPLQSTVGSSNSAGITAQVTDMSSCPPRF